MDHKKESSDKSDRICFATDTRRTVLFREMFDLWQTGPYNQSAADNPMISITVIFFAELVLSL